jgi:primosomal protein N' (replication factor Y)
VCLHCGATRFKNARAGVTRVRDDLAALIGEPVAELTATSDPAEPSTRVVVGTEAVLHRIGRADVVAFLDLDQELLAPRYRAAEQAFALLARGARVAAASGHASGPRAAGRLLLQTRSPEHEVVRAAVHADPQLVADAELARRQLLGFPPCTAMAEVSGAAAPAFIEAFDAPLGIEVAEVAPGRWLLRAADHQVLCDALAEARRPPGRLRIEVDPLRV